MVDGWLEREVLGEHRQIFTWKCPDRQCDWGRRRFHWDISSETFRSVCWRSGL